MLSIILFSAFFHYQTVIKKEQTDPLQDRISITYRLGRFLIYDCEDDHYACVDGDNFKQCQKKRQEHLQQDKRWLSCAPFKEFLTIEDCNKEQMKRVQTLHSHPFCINYKTR